MKTQEADFLSCDSIFTMFVCVLNRKPMDVGRQVQHTGLSRENMVTVLTARVIVTQEMKFWAEVERKKGANTIWGTLGVF